MKKLIEDSLQNSFSYSEYRKKVSDLLAEGKSSGNEQSEDLLHYSQLNEVRMNRLDKTIVVPEEIKQVLSNGVKTTFGWYLLKVGVVTRPRFYRFLKKWLKFQRL